MNDNERTYAQKLLIVRLEDLSEEAYCASWMLHHGEEVWDVITSDRTHYGMVDFDDASRAEWRQLAEDANAWTIDCETLIPLEQWREMFAEYKRLSAAASCLQTTQGWSDFQTAWDAEIERNGY